MKFSLKSIASAVVLAVAVSGAHAAVDQGASGNGELFLNVWDANGSYSFDLNTTIDAFQTSIAAAGNVNKSYALDGFNTFLAGVTDASALKFNVVAIDFLGPRRLLSTFSTMPATTIAADAARSAAGNISGFASSVSTAMGANSYDIVGPAAAAYAGKKEMGNRIQGFLNFDTFGTLSNNSVANGLSFMRIDVAASGQVASKYTAYADNGAGVKVWIDGANLNIAAVPEPESYAMLLAGLGMIGFMARRRQNVA